VAGYNDLAPTSIDNEFIGNLLPGSEYRHGGSIVGEDNGKIPRIGAGNQFVSANVSARSAQLENFVDKDIVDER